MEPRLSQKRSREASLCAELLGGRHPKRIRLAFPPTDDSVAEDWSTLEHLDLHLPISEIGQCGNDGRHGRRVSYRSTSEDCTCVGSTGDWIETVPEQEAVSLHLDTSTTHGFTGVLTSPYTGSLEVIGAE